MKATDYVYGGEAYGYSVSENKEDEKLDILIKESILPNIKKQKNGELSISLCNVLKGNDLSTDDFNNVANELLKHGIVIRGCNPTFDGVENYEYLRTFKNLKEQVKKSLSKEENILLFIEYERAKSLEKKLEVRNKIITGNMKLVPFALFKMAYRFHLPLEELNSYGYEALIESVSYYDYHLGYAFSTYAYYWIYYKTLDAIVENYGHLPRNEYLLYQDILEAKKILEEIGVKDENEFASKIVEIIENVRGDFNPKKRAYVISRININDPIYLDEFPYELTDSDAATDETVEWKVDTELLKKELSNALDTLTPLEKEILKLHFGLEYGKAITLKEIAQKLNFSSIEHVRKIEAKALRKMRHPSRSKRLEVFLW